MEIEKIVQDDMDDGIQDIVVFLSGGIEVRQKWEWPQLEWRDGYNKSAYELYELLWGLKVDVDTLYQFIQKSARLVEGQPLRLE